MKHLFSIALLAVLVQPLAAMEYHVSPQGSDHNAGSQSSPLKTISAAARLAQPGDVITVHKGTYRERINPPRGGTSDARRITYRAGTGEKVVIKGSEVIKGWQRVGNDTWKVIIPNSFFGDFNPYSDLIRGDWFRAKGRDHHTGAVYLNNHWLVEAPTLEDVLRPVGDVPLGGAGPCLLNVSWLRPHNGLQPAARIPASRFVDHRGIQTAPCTEGGECIGWIEHGDWARYEHVDLGDRTEHLEFRAASETNGGIIEIRLDRPNGELLGSCTVPYTGGWQSWSSFTAMIKPTGGIRTLCLVFREARTTPSDNQFWFAGVDEDTTAIWAQFKDVNPNEAEVEINVRQSVFYPDQPGVNYITVRGFTMVHAATNWAPPTAEQVGLIGTHWSKGWIIENNDIRYSTCVGLTLGKHGDEWDNTSQNTAKGYVKTIERGLANGWSKDNIGHHIVRNNHIAHCEQAGIVGSLGAAFCTVTGNEIHDIHVRRLFSGAEMAGIKFHAAIDTEISHNHIYRTTRGIWLDWMTQGTHVARNLLHDNGPSEDLMVEVNHGPFLVGNNVFLSPMSLFDMSQGGAYAHNLFAGRLGLHPELRRKTPYHEPHSTEVAGLHDIPGGDSRFYNNIFVGPAGLASYDKAALPMQMAGNVFFKGASASKYEAEPLVLPDFDPGITLVPHEDGVRLLVSFDKTWAEGTSRQLVTTRLLGKAKIPDLPFEHPDGSPYRIDTDYFGRPRNAVNPFPGPFALSGDGEQMLSVWLGLTEMRARAAQ